MRDRAFGRCWPRARTAEVDLASGSRYGYGRQGVVAECRRSLLLELGGVPALPAGRPCRPPQADGPCGLTAAPARAQPSGFSRAQARSIWRSPAAKFGSWSNSSVVGVELQDALEIERHLTADRDDHPPGVIRVASQPTSFTLKLPNSEVMSIDVTSCGPKCKVLSPSPPPPPGVASPPN